MELGVGSASRLSLLIGTVPASLVRRVAFPGSKEEMGRHAISWRASQWPARNQPLPTPVAASGPRKASLDWRDALRRPSEGGKQGRPFSDSLFGH